MSTDPNELQQWLSLLRVVLAILKQLPQVIQAVRAWRTPAGSNRRPPSRRRSGPRSRS